MRFRPQSCGGTGASRSRASSGRCTRRSSRPRPRRSSPTSTSRRRSFSISSTSTSARSTSTCTARPTSGRTWRGCSTSRGRSRCCWPRPAATASAKGRMARRASRPCTCGRRLTKGRAARWRFRGPTSGGAAAVSSRTGRSGSLTPSAGRRRRWPPYRTRSPKRPSPPAIVRAGRRCRSSSARTTRATRSTTA